MKWEFKHMSPAGGKVYFKGNSIMIVYGESVRLFRNIPADNFIPAMAEYCINRTKYGSYVENDLLIN